MNKPLVLASESQFRKELLSRLGLPFVTAVPDFDEGSVSGLPPRELALARAEGKAGSLKFPGQVVIGSDQVAEVDGLILGKPHTIERAREQLLAMSGKKVNFWTATCLDLDGRRISYVDYFGVTLKNLTPGEISAYVERELPLHCAGSFKIEGLGIALMDSTEGDDYTSLIGLGLISLVKALKELGVSVL